MTVEELAAAIEETTRELYAEMGEDAPTVEELAAAIEETTRELYAEMGEDAPELDESELMDVVDGLMEAERAEPEAEPVEMAQVAEPEKPKQQELSVSFQRDADNKLTGLSVVKREVAIEDKTDA